MRVGLGPSKRVPAYCTGLGKAMLAFMEKEKRLRKILSTVDFVHFTPTTITSPELLFKNFEEIRERGAAYDDCEYEEGLACVAAPIINARNEVVASMSIAYLARYGKTAQKRGLFLILFVM